MTAPTWSDPTMPISIFPLPPSAVRSGSVTLLLERLRPLRAVSFCAVLPGGGTFSARSMSDSIRNPAGRSFRTLNDGAPSPTPFQLRALMAIPVPFAGS